MTSKNNLLPAKTCHGRRVEENRAGVLANSCRTGVGDPLATGTLLYQCETRRNSLGRKTGCSRSQNQGCCLYCFMVHDPSIVNWADHTPTHKYYKTLIKPDYSGKIRGFPFSSIAT